MKENETNIAHHIFIRVQCSLYGKLNIDRKIFVFFEFSKIFFSHELSRGFIIKILII